MIRIQIILFAFDGLKLIKNDDAFLINVANPAVVAYLKEQPKIADDFAVYVYGTVGDKYLEVMKGTGVIFSVFQTTLGFNRL